MGRLPGIGVLGGVGVGGGMIHPSTRYIPRNFVCLVHMLIKLGANLVRGV